MSFSEQGMKAIIYHELVHWLDDSIRNSHIRRRMEKSLLISDVNKANKYVDQGRSYETSPTEIEAQMHELKMFKKYNSDIWDVLTFDQMCRKFEGFRQMRLKTIQKGTYSEWRKLLLKRMKREGLLGKALERELSTIVKNI